MIGKKRAKQLLAKRAAKATRFLNSGRGHSRYAKKQRGEIEPTPNLRLVWCPSCYRKRGRCTCEGVA